MAKLYYGDENNTAVEINVGVSQEYVDSQIEAVSADIHSIPAGGTAGQVLSKVDGTDYNTQWIDPPGGGGSSSFNPTQMTSEKNDISSFINQKGNEDVEYGNGLTQRLTYGAVRYSEHLVKLDMLFDIMVGALYDNVATYIGMNMQNLFNNLIVPALQRNLGVSGNPTIYGIVTATETYDSRYADVFYFMPNNYLMPNFESVGTSKLDKISKDEGFPIEWTHSLTLYFPNN